MGASILSAIYSYNPSLLRITLGKYYYPGKI